MKEDKLLRKALKLFGHVLPYDTTYTFKVWSNLIKEFYGVNDPTIFKIYELLQKRQGKIYRDVEGKSSIHFTKQSAI